MPLTSGAHDVIAYGALALKLKTLLREYVMPFWTISLKLPAAYIVFPHCTICRVRSLVLPGLLTNSGVPAAGVGDTAPGTCG